MRLHQPSRAVDWIARANCLIGVLPGHLGGIDKHVQQRGIAKVAPTSLDLLGGRGVSSERPVAARAARPLQALREVRTRDSARPRHVVGPGTPRTGSSEASPTSKAIARFFVIVDCRC